MSTYFNWLQPALQNLLQHVVRFFHPRSSCMMTHISTDVQRITLYASCMMISGERIEQLDIFCHITGFTSDFLSFIDVELIWFFHGALQLPLGCVYFRTPARRFIFQIKLSTNSGINQKLGVMLGQVPKINSMGDFYLLDISMGQPHPYHKGGGTPALPNLGYSLLFICPSFDAEPPNLML